MDRVGKVISRVSPADVQVAMIPGRLIGQESFPPRIVRTLETRNISGGAGSLRGGGIDAVVLSITYLADQLKDVQLRRPCGTGIKKGLHVFVCLDRCFDVDASEAPETALRDTWQPSRC